MSAASWTIASPVVCGRWCHQRGLRRNRRRGSSPRSLHRRAHPRGGHAAGRPELHGRPEHRARRAPQRDVRAGLSAAGQRRDVCRRAARSASPCSTTRSALNLGISTFVSVGNKADVSGNDLIEYWADDPRHRRDPALPRELRQPAQFARSRAGSRRRKPIVAVKSGRSAAGARAASSHRRAGLPRRRGRRALRAVRRHPHRHARGAVRRRARCSRRSRCRRAGASAIVTNAGGPGILAADACEAARARAAGARAGRSRRCASFLPPQAAIGEPGRHDRVGDAPSSYERALATLLDDEAMDSVLVIFIPPLVTKGEDVAAAIKRVTTSRPAKPVLAIFMSAQSAGPMLDPIPCFSFPEAAAVALARASTYGDWRRQPEAAPATFDDVDRDGARAIVDRVLQSGGGWLTPDDAQSLLSAVRIPLLSVTSPRVRTPPSRQPIASATRSSSKRSARRFSTRPKSAACGCGCRPPGTCVKRGAT